MLVLFVSTILYPSQESFVRYTSSFTTANPAGTSPQRYEEAPSLNGSLAWRNGYPSTLAIMSLACAVTNSLTQTAVRHFATASTQTGDKTSIGHRRQLDHIGSRPALRPTCHRIQTRTRVRTPERLTKAVCSALLPRITITSQ